MLEYILDFCSVARGVCINIYIYIATAINVYERHEEKNARARFGSERYRVTISRSNKDRPIRRGPTEVSFSAENRGSEGAFASTW